MTALAKKVMRFHAMDALAFAITAVIFAPLIWWIADRSPPVIFEGYDLFPPKVRPGETIYRVVKVNRLRHCITDPDTVMIDGAKVRWQFDEPPLLSPGPLGHDSYKRPMVIPMQANPGTAEIRVSATYVCNPIHKIWPIKVIAEPLTFEIVP